jgi:peroxiredoxin
LEFWINRARAAVIGGEDAVLSIQINNPAPDFELPDLEGKVHRLSDYRGKIVIINFWSCECPHSERTDKIIMPMFVQWRDHVTMLSIAANRSENVEALKIAADARRLPTVMIDADCKVADMYEAQTTPHVYVIDREGILRYRGAVDDVTFRNRIPSRFFLDEAVESLLENRLPTLAESPAYGCTIVREI